MTLLHLLRRSSRQWPLKTHDGRWDMALWVDMRGLNSMQVMHGRYMQALAIREGIHPCINAHNMADLPVHTLFLVGHNVGREQPGLLKDVYDLGKKLQGRYLILNSCEHVTAAQSIGWQENRLLLKHTKAAGIYAYHSTIPIAGVSQMFTQLIKLSSQHPELLSGQLIDIAIKRTFATAEAQNDKSTPN